MYRLHVLWYIEEGAILFYCDIIYIESPQAEQEGVCAAEYVCVTFSVGTTHSVRSC